MPKFLKAHGFNLLLSLGVLYFLAQRAPGIVELYRLEGQPAAVTQVIDLNSGSPIDLPFAEKKVLVFWATWCGPCKVELARINKLIENGAIPAESVVAVSVKEEASLVADFVKKNNYLFKVALDESGQAAQLYQVAGTPTIYFIDESGKTEWVTMGLSPSLEIRLKSFLN
ncbi:MAG: TlpA family protein disulfide reductase [Bdellovibrio sp.]|nr:TlpA family protein disulfide reductase [Bdellovibrio sp.]